MNYYRQQFLSPSLKFVFIVILTALFFFVSQVKAATYISTVAGGAWEVATTWSPAGIPNANDNVTIRGPVTRVGGSSFNGTGLITIQNGGTLTVTGNYSIGTSGVRIILTGTGSMSVQGTFTIANQAFMNMQSTGSLSAGTLILSDNSGSGINYTSGTITITGGGSIYVGAAETFSYPNTMTVPGGVTVRNGSTLNVSGTVSGGVALNAGSTVILKSGTMNPSGLSWLNANDEIRIDGATVNYSSNLTVNPGKLTVISGSFNSTGTLTVNGGTFSTTSPGVAASGNLVVGNAGSTVFTNNGRMNVTGTVSTTSSVSNGGTLNVSGTYTQQNTGQTLNNTGTMNIGGLTDIQGGTFVNSGTINVGTSAANADFQRQNAGAPFTSTGFMNITGNATFVGPTNFGPGASADSRIIVSKNLTISGGGFTVGTAVAPPNYADLIVYGNLIHNGSNITVQCNGRVAIWGDLNISTGGGHALNIQNCGTGPGGVPIGGQVYVDGDEVNTPSRISINSGSGGVNNNNPTFNYNGSPTPYGLYVNGGVSGPVDADRGSVAVMQNSNAPFAAWVASYTNNPLPVKLAYFKVQNINENGIALAWSTTMEKNFDKFEVEHAGENLVFSSVTSIAGKGGANLNVIYEHVHRTPFYGKNYYRLKMIDLDGSFEYSDVIVGNWNSNSNSGVSLYPNPVVDRTFTLELNDARTAPVTVSVFESRGVIVYSTQIDSATSTVSLPDDLKAGVYLVKIADAHGQQLVRIVVM